MKSKTVWIVVADGGRARVLKANEGMTKLDMALDYELVADRRPSRDIDADRPGRTRDRAAQGRHAYEPPTDPHEHEKIEFARKIARLLDEERKKLAYDELILVAAPKMLGLLRETLPRETLKLLRAEVPKDFSKLKLHELREKLPALV